MGERGEREGGKERVGERVRERGSKGERERVRGRGEQQHVHTTTCTCNNMYMQQHVQTTTCTMYNTSVYLWSSVPAVPLSSLIPFSSNSTFGEMVLNAVQPSGYSFCSLRHSATSPAMWIQQWAACEGV